MTVWLLIEDHGFDGDIIHGVFSTKDAAEEYMERWRVEHQDSQRSDFIWDVAEWPVQG